MELSSAFSRGKNVLITGASSGIGLELARIFARNGYDLVLVARNKPRLQELAQELSERYNNTTRVIVQDLEQAEATDEIFQKLQKAEITIDVLVNNAGFGTSGSFADSILEREQALIQVNITALISLTRLFLPSMLNNRRGKILNLASTAAFQPGPYMANYYASKAYVLSFSEALAAELKGTGVSVTTLCPGPTVTEFAQRSNMRSSLLKSNFMTQNAQTVAEIGYRGLMRNKKVVIPGAFNLIGSYATKLLPRQIGTNIVKKIQK